MAPAPLDRYTSLQQLVALIEGGGPVFVRWSRGPEVDLGDQAASRDELTGVTMPGLSANPLGVEDWWQGSTRLWAARRLYDYSHLREVHGPDVSPWLLTGREVGRGPDNEPLVRDVTPVAWIDDRLVAEVEREVADQAGAWGPMRRPRRFAGRRPEDGPPDQTDQTDETDETDEADPTDPPGPPGVAR